MRRIYLGCLVYPIILLVTMSCSAFSSESGISKSTTVPNIATVTPPVASTNVILLTPPVQVDLNPEIVHYCPSDRDIPLSELGMDKSIGLLMKGIGGVDDTALILLLADNSLKKIPAFSAPSGLPYEFTSISSDGKWFVYVTKSESNNNSLLVTNFNGSKKWEWTIPVENYSYLAWTKNGQIVFWGQDGLPGRESRDVPIAIINPFTGESHFYTNLSIPADGIVMLWFEENNSSYVIYYYPYHFDKSLSEYRANFVLYNLNQDLSEDIFTWMEPETKQWTFYNLIFLFLSLDQNKEFSIVYSRPYGFDFIHGMSIDRVDDKKAYDQTMQPVLLPGDQPSMEVSSFANDQSRFYFVRYDDTDYQSPLPEALYFYDMESNILGDYCVDLGYTGFHLRSYLSPDNRFLAWKDFGVEPRDQPIGTKILDTSNGKITTLSGYEVLYWVVLE